MGTDDAPIAVVVDAARRGDENAWNEIVDRFTPLLLGVLVPYRLPRSQTEDVAQTVWLRLVEHLDDLREPRALPMWLITTARREAVRSVALARRTQPRDPQDEAWSGFVAPLQDPVADLVRSEQREAFLEAFATLSPRQRQLLLVLSEDPPVAYAQISRRVGIPVGAIGPTRARALERLRRAPALARHLAHHSDATATATGRGVA